MLTKKRFMLLLYSLLIVVAATNSIIAQNQKIGTLNVDDGTNSTTYNTDALVHFQSNSKGLLLPRIALTATNSALPLSAFTAGMTVYNTATAGTAPNNVVPGYYYSDGTQWIRLADASGATLAGDITGTLAATNVAKLQGTGLDLTTTPPSANQVLQYNGTKWVAANVAGGGGTAGWALTGNSGTTAGTNFLGTTDNQDLIFKRSGVQAGLLGTTNTAFGVSSLPNTGSNNTALGNSSLAMLNVIGGSNNVAVGANAGNNQFGGSSNIVIGASQNLASPTGSSQLNIGGAIFGTGLTGSASAPAGSIGIGTTAPSATLDVNGNTRIRTMGTSTNSDYVVTADANGNLRKSSTPVTTYYTTVYNTVIDQTINFKGTNDSYTMTGDEDVVWLSGPNQTLTFPTPTDAQIKRGRIIHIVASFSDITFAGLLPTVVNSTTISSLPYGNRISVVPVYYSNAKGWYVIAASKAFSF